jgi:hypothetical protein
MAIREGAWDCPSCGRKKIRGSAKYCPGCGAPRGDGVRFYLPDDSPEVTAAEELARAQAGPDWICAYCEADNPADAAFCTGCGAAKAEGQARQVQEIKAGAAAPPPPPIPVAAPVAKKGWGRWGKGCGIGCLGLIVLFLFLVFYQRDVDLTPTGHHWVRTVQVEALREVTREAWEGEVPAGARVISSQRALFRTDKVQIGSETRTRTVTERVQTGTERVKTGVRDLGNGYFEDIYEDQPVYEDRERTETYDEPVYKEVPVYKMKYRFNVDEWQPVREAKAEGDDQSPVWPEVQLGANERIGPRKEDYKVLFRDPDGKTVEHPVGSEAEWLGFKEGEAYKAETNISGKIQRILGPSDQ